MFTIPDLIDKLIKHSVNGIQAHSEHPKSGAVNAMNAHARKQTKKIELVISSGNQCLGIVTELSGHKVAPAYFLSIHRLLFLFLILIETDMKYLIFFK